MNPIAIDPIVPMLPDLAAALAAPLAVLVALALAGTVAILFPVLRSRGPRRRPAMPVVLDVGAPSVLEGRRARNQGAS